MYSYMHLSIFAHFLCFHREKDDDEGIPSETEEDKKLLESKAKEMRGNGLEFQCYPH